MSEKQKLIDKLIDFHKDSPFLQQIVLKELEELDSLFKTGEEEYLIISIEFDRINDQLYNQLGGLDSVLGEFYKLSDDMEDQFEFNLIKNDKVVYYFNSNDIEWDEFDDEDEEFED